MQAWLCFCLCVNGESFQKVPQFLNPAEAKNFLLWPFEDVGLSHCDTAIAAYHVSQEGLACLFTEQGIWVNNILHVVFLSF